MLLAIDIGNTNIVVGGIANDQIVFEARIATDPIKTSDQQLKLEVGCEVMLRVGTATVVSNTEPGLIDVTTGGTLGNGKGLEKNHLYMATIADRAVKAGADTVKLLVRGGYTLG